MKKTIVQELNEHIKTTESLFNLVDQISTSAKICIDSLNNGGKILLFGNGGSAADSTYSS